MEDAYQTFSRGDRRGFHTILLLDAEGPVTARSPWQHLRKNDGWSRPGDATDTQCYFMVQVMESWFLADIDTLESFLRPRFPKAVTSGKSDDGGRSKARRLGWAK